MKFVKLGIFTLALGMFIASCGNNEEATEEPATEETTEMAPAAEEAPVAEPVVDTTAPATEAAPAPEATAQ